MKQNEQTEVPNYDGYTKYDRTVAQSYDETRENEEHWVHEMRFVEKYFRDRKIHKLLDLPVGTGRFFAYYSGVSNLTGVDISEEMLNEARKKIHLLPQTATVQLEQGDVFALRFEDFEFEAVIVMRLFHLIPENMLLGAIKELCRVTRGDIVVQTYAPIKVLSQKRPSILKRIAARLHRELTRPIKSNSCTATTPWSHIQAFYHSQALIDSMFNSCGFDVSLSERLDVYHGNEVNATIYSKKLL